MALGPEQHHRHWTSDVDRYERGIDDAIVKAKGWPVVFHVPSDIFMLSKVEKKILKRRYLAAGWACIEFDDGRENGYGERYDLKVKLWG